MRRSRMIRRHTVLAAVAGAAWSVVFLGTRRAQADQTWTGTTIFDDDGTVGINISTVNEGAVIQDVTANRLVTNQVTFHGAVSLGNGVTVTNDTGASWAIHAKFNSTA